MCETKTSPSAGIPCVAWISIDPRQSLIDAYPGHVASVLENAWQCRQKAVCLGSSFYGATVELSEHKFVQTTTRGNRDVLRVELACPTDEVVVYVIHESSRRGWRVSRSGAGEIRRVEVSPDSVLLLDAGSSPQLAPSSPSSPSPAKFQDSLQDAMLTEQVSSFESQPDASPDVPAESPEQDIKDAYASSSIASALYEVPIAEISRDYLHVLYFSIAISLPGECKICFEVLPGESEDISANSLMCLRCPSSHRFCRSCLLQHVGSQRFPRCPGDGCQYELTEEELVILGTDDDRLAKFQHSALDRAIDSLGKIVHCPNPDCSSACMVDEDSWRERFECGCGWPAWCTTCRQPYHYHTECGEVQALRHRWLEWISHGRAEYHNDSLLHSVHEGQRCAVEDALTRHTELQDDEAWKAQNCRQCPKCRRTVQKVDGCSAMICGQNYHGGNEQPGCGHKFDWKSARSYKLVDQAVNLPPLDAAQVRLKGANLRHAFCRCSACGAEIVGPRFRCVHCPDFNLCVACDRKRDSGIHTDDHVFQIMFEAEYDLGAFLPAGTIVEITDGSERHGFQAKVVERKGDQYKVCLLSDKSERFLERAHLHPHLSGVGDVESLVRAQLAEEQRAKKEENRRRVELQRQVEKAAEQERRRKQKEAELLQLRLSMRESLTEDLIFRMMSPVEQERHLDRVLAQETWDVDAKPSASQFVREKLQSTFFVDKTERSSASSASSLAQETWDADAKPSASKIVREKLQSTFFVDKNGRSSASSAPVDSPTHQASAAALSAGPFNLANVAAKSAMEKLQRSLPARTKEHTTAADSGGNSTAQIAQVSSSAANAGSLHVNSSRLGSSLWSKTSVNADAAKTALTRTFLGKKKDKDQTV